MAFLPPFNLSQTMTSQSSPSPRSFDPLPTNGTSTAAGPKGDPQPVTAHSHAAASSAPPASPAPPNGNPGAPASRTHSKAYTPPVPSSYVGQFAADAASARPVPQLQPFSQSTQDILNRIGTAHNVTAGSPEWEAARRQVLQSMAGANTNGIPADARESQTPPIRGRGRGRPPLPKTIMARAAAAPGTPDASTPVTTPVKRGAGGSAGRSRGRSGRGRKRGTKRKRSDEDDDGDDSSSLSSVGSTNGDATSTPKEPTITKSGRSINKPTQFTPAPKTDSPSTTPGRKARKPTRRNIEAAVCAKCLRGHSTASNVIVFCDGCNTPWHQFCHDPSIGTDVILVAEKEWFCGTCDAEREDARLPMDERVGAGELSVDERAAYLDTLPRPILARLLLDASKKHPDLPMFAPNTRDMLRARARGQPNGQTASMLNGGETENDPYPDYSLAARTNDPPSTYPRPGKGPIPPKATTNAEDLEWLIDDDNGFETFSHFYNPSPQGPGSLVPVQTESNGKKGSWIQHGKS